MMSFVAKFRLASRLIYPTLMSDSNMVLSTLCRACELTREASSVHCHRVRDFAASIH